MNYLHNNKNAVTNLKTGRMNEYQIKWYVFMGIFLLFLGRCLDFVTVNFTLITHKSDAILVAIPIYVILLAFFVGKPIGRLGLLHISLFGVVLTCFSVFLQIFYFNNMSITQIAFSFICLSCMWSLGSTLSVIVNNFEQARVSLL
ncbi:hypothetical protein Lsai_1834 [Legionella sainthelensi]|uniref:Uncharacterized protein n=2 Tax=Legionella sainthelensi TaxID=28087 RepID=A0A0W0YIS0_9GAMM|nr:hypothetical protein [Legionella sainthelensi]KTD56857.1 hypothetical protein Lsai_1834 [Legionella sainthelensi]VEH37079.1 Uncharacterised protein [Legionella sainthelensi]